MKKVMAVKPMEGFRLWLKFSDGYEGVADLSDLCGQGVFAAWNEAGRFEQVKLTEFGAVEWEGGIDLCPDTLYLRASGKKPEDLFPSLQQPAAHA
jgi:uncharacterized protein DUF2442